MSREKSSIKPLQLLIRRSISWLPVNTGQVRRHARGLCGSDRASTIVLADVSASMNDLAWGGRRKRDLLHDAVEAVMSGMTKPIKLVAFSSKAWECQKLPARVEGGTALHLALMKAAVLKPKNTLVISDGQPDSEEKALKAAQELPGRIDVLYIGSETEKAALKFMRELADIGCGQFLYNDIRGAYSMALAHNIRYLIENEH